MWLATPRRERPRFMATMASLTDAEFDTGTTPCAGWAPRNVLTHVRGSTEALALWLAGRESVESELDFG